MRSRSLRIRVAAFLLVPMAALAVTLSAGGTWFVHTFVTSAYDRVLAGSILSIAERLTVQDGTVSVELPAAAFGMLSNSERDSIFYSVTDKGTFVTGYPDLPLPATLPPPETLTYRDAVFRGQRVRIGMMLKPIYVTNHRALVQVAETMQGRDHLEGRMLTALTALVAVLSGIGGLLVWFAVRMGLAPLDELRREVELRRLQRRGDVPAFSVAGVPREAVSFVSALNELLAQLNRAMAVQRQFTADASHQLRTPLAILKSHLDLLDRHPPGSAAWQASRDDIGAAVGRLERLIAQLLTLAAAEGKAAPIADACPVDLVALAREATADLAGLARRHGVELSFEATDHPCAAVAPLLVEEILCNLIDNAVRYAGRGAQVCVRIRVPEPGTACIEVEDDGPGIPEAQRTLVFERFHRLEREGDPGGSGLGLSIVRAFAERLAGRVSLHDGRDGRGLLTRITLTALPLAAEEADAERIVSA